MPVNKPILEFNNLDIRFGHGKDQNIAVNQLDLSLYESEILGIVGESGSGKTVSSLAVLQLLDTSTAKVLASKMKYKDQDLLALAQNSETIRSIRGNKISMIFQEPMSSFNPTMRLGKQVKEAFTIHNPNSKDVNQVILSLFEKVKLPDPERVFNAYPHEVSGGQLQRVMIAMAIINKPDVIIADEPTTALDVSIQKDILALLVELKNELSLSVILISHDLRLIKNYCDRVMIMRHGELIESGKVSQVFGNPQEDYTKGLINCIPTLKTDVYRLPTLDNFKQSDRKKELDKYTGEVILDVQSINKTYKSKKGLFGSSVKVTQAVSDVSFSLRQGEILGLVGQSGCGKSTLSKIVVGMLKQDSGRIYYKGDVVSELDRKNSQEYRKKVQYIFQNPYSSLNPKFSILKTLSEPLLVHKLCAKADIPKRVAGLLESVELDESFKTRMPNELSGGQRQRVVIARALAIQPEILICDESVSALDVSVQASIINLLLDLREQKGISIIFISHDLALTKYISDRVMVMDQGKLVDIFPADEWENPNRHKATLDLIEAYR